MTPGLGKPGAGCLIVSKPNKEKSLAGTVFVSCLGRAKAYCLPSRWQAPEVGGLHGAAVPISQEA